MLEGKVLIFKLFSVDGFTCRGQIWVSFWISHTQPSTHTHTARPPPMLVNPGLMSFTNDSTYNPTYG